MLYFDLLKYVSSEVILAKFMVLHDWAIEELAEARDDLVNYPLSNLHILLHAYVLLFKLV